MPQTTAPSRRVAVIGAASSIGIRPYDDGRARQLDRAPAVTRELGLVERLDAVDHGDVAPPPYRDFVRPPSGVRNEQEVGDYSRALADRVAAATSAGNFTLVLGGDCSIVLGSLLGATRTAGPAGLAYFDAHADFATPEESMTGSAASMCLALAVGRGDSPLARLAGAQPLVRAEHTALVGRRDAGQTYYGHTALRDSGILDIPGPDLAADPADSVTRVQERLEQRELHGFWIHVDADLLNPSVMPAVDSPEPGGPDLDALAALVAPLARHPRALGMQLTIYDPGLDPDRSCAARLVEFLARVLNTAEKGETK